MRYLLLAATFFLSCKAPNLKSLDDLKDHLPKQSNWNGICFQGHPLGAYIPERSFDGQMEPNRLPAGTGFNLPLRKFGVTPMSASLGTDSPRHAGFRFWSDPSSEVAGLIPAARHYIEVNGVLSVVDGKISFVVSDMNGFQLYQINALGKGRYEMWALTAGAGESKAEIGIHTGSDRPATILDTEPNSLLTRLQSNGESLEKESRLDIFDREGMLITRIDLPATPKNWPLALPRLFFHRYVLDNFFSDPKATWNQGMHADEGFYVLHNAANTSELKKLRAKPTTPEFLPHPEIILRHYSAGENRDKHRWLVSITNSIQGYEPEAYTPWQKQVPEIMDAEKFICHLHFLNES